MNKDKILRKSEDFSNIISTGNTYKNKYFSIYYKESNSTIKLIKNHKYCGFSL